MFFMIITLLLTVIFLNMLIAVMAETYNRETAIRKQSALKEKIIILSDYTFINNMIDSSFDTRFIYIFK